MIIIDIVVTIPKREYKNDDEETQYLLNNPDAYQFWSLGRKPNKLKVGDKVYFVKNNVVESSMIIKDIEKGKPQLCDVTSRIWEGGYMLWLQDLRDETYLNIQCKGFQGFRYRWWEDKND